MSLEKLKIFDIVASIIACVFKAMGMISLMSFFIYIFVKKASKTI